MTWRPRARQLILWSAATTSMLLAAVWIGSVWYTLWWDAPDGGAVHIQSGRFAYSFPSDGDHSIGLRLPAIWRTSANMDWQIDWGSGDRLRFIWIPLWAPLTLSTAITAFAWRKEAIARRRANQHKCPACNYDRAGINPTAACPECGKTQQA